MDEAFDVKTEGRLEDQMSEIELEGAEKNRPLFEKCLPR